MAYIGQREDEWEAEQRKKARKQARKISKVCPECGKRLKNMKGLKQHLRDIHKLKIVPPKPAVIETISIEMENK